MYKISVVVPIYNSSKYLNRCIDSIVNQSYQNLEIVLVDDGSTDNSYEICRNYQLNDNRIKLIKKNNGGVGSARNIGIDNSTGDLIIFIDSDDYCDNKMLESLVNGFNDVSFTMCSIQVVDIDENAIEYQTLDAGVYSIEEFSFNYLLKYKTEIICGALYNKLFDLSIIKKNSIRFILDITFAEDFIFFLEYMKYSQNVYFTSLGRYFYRKDVSGSLTYNNYKKFNVDKYWFSCKRAFDSWKNLFYKYEQYKNFILDINSLYKDFLFITLNMCMKSSRKYAIAKEKLFKVDMDRYENLRILKEAKFYSFKDRFVYYLYKNKLFYLWYILKKFKL